MSALVCRIDPHPAKPAVPLGGKYCLIDTPISNCLNSGIL
jgi:ADP-glucose pyrophosphorylase